ncbi:MAG TPA: TetR/AcrR family transcriptional regulator [Spirochaetota bacterium]|nr:TetR/AcrR family transcriptional regulator [Spirochaetota bacterium]
MAARKPSGKKIIVRMSPEERRSQILDSARKLFASGGYYQTQISDIQKESDIARGTVYQYFKSKDDIFTTILEDLFIKWKTALSDTPDPGSEEYRSGIKFFRYKIKNSFEFFADNPDYCNLLLKIGLGLGENFDILISRFDYQIVELAKKYLTVGIKLKRIKSDTDVELVANLIGGAFMRMAYYYGVTRKNKGSIDIDKLSERFANTFSYGIFMEESES